MSTLELEHLKHSSAGSNAISLAADGSLTLATVSNNLQINNASGSQITLHRPDTTIANDDLYGQIIMSGDDADTNASGTRGFIRGRSQGTGGGLKMEFGTAGGGVAIGDPRMTINADGHVLIPNQPSFLAFGALANISSAGYIAYPNLTSVQGGHNIGSHYNTGTYRFTAPVAGRYLFGFSVYANTTNAVDVYGRINNSNSVSGHQVNAGSADDHYPTVAGSCLVNLSANDDFGWYMTGGTYHTNTTGSMFYGYLLG